MLLGGGSMDLTSSLGGGETTLWGEVRVYQGAGHRVQCGGRAGVCKGGMWRGGGEGSLVLN
jgi:hypothetical protein